MRKYSRSFLELLHGGEMALIMGNAREHTEWQKQQQEREGGKGRELFIEMGEHIVEVMAHEMARRARVFARMEGTEVQRKEQLRGENKRYRAKRLKEGNK